VQCGQLDRNIGAGRLEKFVDRRRGRAEVRLDGEAFARYRGAVTGGVDAGDLERELGFSAPISVASARPTLPYPMSASFFS
jgi:hypothetical protein